MLSSVATFIVPGLLNPPADNTANSTIDTLQRAKSIYRILSLAQRQCLGVHFYEATLGYLLNCNDQKTGYIPIATLEQAQRFKTGHFLRASFVHLQVDRDHIRLQRALPIKPQRGELDSILSTLNTHFDGETVLLSDGANTAYLRTPTAAQIDMQPPTYAAGRNIGHFMPRGKSGAYWKKWLTEVQMLLHEHPVNLARANSGLPTINCLWLWGGGTAPKRPEPRYEAVFGDSALVELAATHCSIEWFDRAEIDALKRYASTLWVDESLYRSTVSGNAEQWTRTLLQIEERLFKPLFRALYSGAIKRVEIYPCNGICYRLSWLGLFKFWYRNLPLSALAQAGFTT